MKNIATFALIAFLASCSHSVGDAPKDAKRFAFAHYDNVKSVACMAQDSDGNGYVSCTIFLPDNETAPIECATGNVFADGCGGNKGCRVAVGAGSR